MLDSSIAMSRCLSQDCMNRIVELKLLQEVAFMKVLKVKTNSRSLIDSVQVLECERCQFTCHASYCCYSDALYPLMHHFLIHS